MAQYARELPVDKNNNPYITSSPNFAALQSWGSVFTVSSTVGLSDRTTVLQVTAIGQTAFLKWGTSSITGTNFDAAVPSGLPQLFVVPQSVFGNFTGSSVMGANGANGLYNSVSIKQSAIGGSVFGCEY